MKKNPRLLCLLLSLLLALSLCACSAAEPAAQPTEAPEAQPTEAAQATGVPAEETLAFTPGTYHAEAMGHNAVIAVDATFSENEITGIEVVQHSESKGIGDVAMDEMRAEILARQSLNVDTLSGATITGAVFRSIVTDCVKQAGGDPTLMQEPAPASTLTAQDLSADVDVVVVGSGGAGLAAAVTAYDEGLRVILVEQLDILGGSSDRAGGLSGANTKLLAENGLTYTQEDYYAYLSAPASVNLSPDLIDEEYCRGLSVRAGENIDWLTDLGVEFGTPFGNGNHWGVDNSRVAWSIVKQLKSYMDEKGIDYRTGTKATALLMDGDAVVGIRAEKDGLEYEIRASSVILATGGYLANKELVAKYKPGYENNGFDVTIGCDGSGLELALNAGAVAKHMDICGFHALATSYNGVSRSLTNPASSGCIAVNAAGQRYANEAGAYADFTAATMEQDQVFCIMDETVMNQGKIRTDTGLSNILEMYVICDTIQELATKLGIDPEGLAATVERYGEFVRNGVDEDFGKAATALTGDFSTGLYYGVKANVENHTVYGGIEIDNNGRVLREDGTAIDGLYAAGELTMFKTAGRAPLPESIDMGRVAARSIKAALAE